MYSANELYAMPVGESTNKLFQMWLFEALYGYWNMGIPDSYCNEHGWDYSNERILLSRIRCQQHDYRRSASIYKVEFDGEPIMLYWRAGREEDDYEYQVITCSEERWQEFMKYLAGVVLKIRTPEHRDPDEKVAAYTNFYSTPDVFAENIL